MTGWGRFWLFVGATLAGLAVAAGAMAAHFLDTYVAEKYNGASPKIVAGQQVPLSVKRMNDFRTGAEYQMYHALALVAVGLMCRTRPSAAIQAAGWSFLFGIVLFSWTLYLLALTGMTWFGMITPIGGVLFIVGWGLLAIGALSTKWTY